MFLSRVSRIPMFILDTARLLPTRHGMDTSEDTSVSRKRPVAAVALMSGTCITFVPCSYGWLGNYWWKLNLKGEKGNKKSEGISRWNVRFQRFLRLESRVLFKTSIYFNIQYLLDLFYSAHHLFHHLAIWDTFKATTKSSALSCLMKSHNLVHLKTSSWCLQFLKLVLGKPLRLCIDSDSILDQIHSRHSTVRHRSRLLLPFLSSNHDEPASTRVCSM